MPPHLHPRSTATSTLFAGTLLASFVVVSIPHIFPCPVPRRGYADSERQLVDKDGNPIANKGRALKQPQSEKTVDAQKAVKKHSRTLQDEAELFRQLQAEAELLDKQARECPVPKPKGWIGQMLGFQNPPSTTPSQSQSQSKG